MIYRQRQRIQVLEALTLAIPLSWSRTQRLLIFSIQIYKMKCGAGRQALSNEICGRIRRQHALILILRLSDALNKAY